MSGDMSLYCSPLDEWLIMKLCMYVGYHTANNVSNVGGDPVYDLSNRKQYTEIEDTTSTILPIQVGVPQGSILGSILFIIYINDLPQCSNKFDFIMYADDTTLSSTIDSFSDIYSNASADCLINAEIGKVIEWLKINKLSLNKNKSIYMTFHMPKKQIQHLTLKIDGINIEKVEEFYFLGLTMDTNLKWKKHTDKFSNKCSKITGVLNLD